MDKLRELFEYQRFAQNPKLQRIIDSVCGQYLDGAEELDDAYLDVSAAGDSSAAKPRGNPLERSQYDRDRNGN